MIFKSRENKVCAGLTFIFASEFGFAIAYGTQFGLLYLAALCSLAFGCCLFVDGIT